MHPPHTASTHPTTTTTTTTHSPATPAPRASPQADQHHAHPRHLQALRQHLGAEEFTGTAATVTAAPGSFTDEAAASIVRAAATIAQQTCAGRTDAEGGQAALMYIMYGHVADPAVSAGVPAWVPNRSFLDGFMTKLPALIDRGDADARRAHAAALGVAPSLAQYG